MKAIILTVLSSVMVVVLSFPKYGDLYSAEAAANCLPGDLVHVDEDKNCPCTCIVPGTVSCGMCPALKKMEDTVPKVVELRQGKVIHGGDVEDSFIKIDYACLVEAAIGNVHCMTDKSTDDLTLEGKKAFCDNKLRNSGIRCLSD